MASGAPDWQKVFTLVPPSMTHGAPDWQRTAVGPSGEPITAIQVLGQMTAIGADLLDGGTVTLGTVVCTNTAPGLAMLAFDVPFADSYAGPSLVSEYLQVEAGGGDIAGFSSPGLPTYSLATQGDNGYYLGHATWCGLVMLTAAAATIDLVLFAAPDSIVTTTAGTVLAVWV
jgi:hypothetical protein